MSHKLRNIVLIILALGLAGCARTVVPQPGAITLEQAMKSVGTGLRAMREAEGGLKTGLIADEVQVTFNITASGTDSGSLHVEMTPIPTNPAAGKVSTDLSSSYTALRGNQITIKFKNLMTASSKDTLITNTDELTKILKIIESSPSTGPVGLPKPTAR